MVIGIFLILIVAIALMAVSLYNRLVRLQNNIIKIGVIYF